MASPLILTGVELSEYVRVLGKDRLWGAAEWLQGYRGSMEYLKGPLYLDIAAKGLCLAGVALMVFGQGSWFIVGVFAVFIGMLIGAWAMVAARRTRSLGDHPAQAPLGARTRRDGGAKEGGNS